VAEPAARQHNGHRGSDDFSQRRDALIAELGGTAPEDDELASEELSAITTAPQAPGLLP
jgi:hypothetical protein